MVVISIFSRINYMSRNNLRIVVCMHHGPMTPIWIHEYMFFKRQSAYLWVQTVLLFSPTYSLFVWGRLLKKKEKKLAQSFNFTFRYINDVLSLNNSRFSDFINRLYPIELKIKWQCRALRTKLYDKRDDFNFPFENFPFLCSNIQPAAAYGVYISQLIQYSRACGSLIEDCC